MQISIPCPPECQLVVVRAALEPPTRAAGYEVTERYIYDLRNEMERERFFMEVRFGWQYYKNQILGHLVIRKKEAACAGNYDGRNMPIGYTVHYEKMGSKVLRLWEIQPEHSKELNSIKQRLRLRA